MFRKLVSNLPFSPALVGQLAFYARRLKKEQVTRKLGLLFAVLAVAVQSFAVLNPPQQVNAVSNPAPSDQTPAVSSLARHKEVKNLSQLPENTGTLIKAGDRIEYTLQTTNNGDSVATFNIEENLTDVLDYGQLFENGGGFFDNVAKKLVWEDIILEPGKTDTRRFVVLIFDAIPTTPRFGNSYDCVVTNTYGNTVSLPIECPATKYIETTIQQLPTTGPGENTLFAAGLLIVTTYFYARNRQLNKEVRLLRKEFNGGTI